MVAATGSGTRAGGFQGSGANSTTGRNAGTSNGGSDRDGGTRGGVGSGGGTGKGSANSGSSGRSGGSDRDGGTRGGVGSGGGTGSGNAGRSGGSDTGNRGPQGRASSSGPSSGPGGAGGVRNSSGGTRQSATSANVGGGTQRGSILSNPSRAVTSSGLLNGAMKGAAQYGLGQTYSGPKGGILGLNTAARMASAVRAGYPNIPSVAPSPRDLDLATRIALAESSAIKNQFGMPNTSALQAVADVMRNRVLSSRFPGTLGNVVTQPNAFSAYNPDMRKSTLSKFGPNNPNYDSTRSLLSSVMSGEAAPVVGNSLNYGNLHSIANPGSISNPAQRASLSSQKSFGGMPVEASFASASNPNMQHSFGTIGAPSDVNLGNLGTPTPPVSLADAARTTSMSKMQDRISPNMADMNMAGYNSPMAGVGSLPSLRDATRNMNMAGYQSPMASVGNLPSEPGSMNMAGYRSPMGGLTGMPQAPGRMNMAGYSSPMEGTTGMPQAPGNMNMAGYNSPMTGLTGMPRAPSGNIAGMSFNPGMPGQMTPSMNMSGFNSPMASVTTNLPSIQAPRGIPNQPGIGQPIGTPTTAQMAGLGGFANPAPPQQAASGGLFAGLGQALKDKVVAPVQRVADLVKDNIANPGLLFLTPPGPDSPYVGGGEGRPLRGGDHPAQWTGNEPPPVVAQMQQHVEDVLRSYFTGELVNPPATSLRG